MPVSVSQSRKSKIFYNLKMLVVLARGPIATPVEAASATSTQFIIFFIIVFVLDFTDDKITQKIPLLQAQTARRGKFCEFCYIFAIFGSQSLKNRPFHRYVSCFHSVTLLPMRCLKAREKVL